MSDVALEWNDSVGAASVVIEANDLKADAGLRTALLISLFTDAPARPGDQLPDGTIAKGGERGWWADAFPVVAGDVVGCRLWLLARAKETPDILARAVEYAREGCAWLVTQKVAGRVDVTAEFLTRQRGFGITVSVVRPSGVVTSHTFDRTWTAEATR